MLCPNVPPDFFQSQLGVDPQGIVTFFEEEYGSFLELVEENSEMADDVTEQVSSALDTVSNTIESTQEYLWVMPLMIACSMILTTLSVTGVLVVMYMEDKTDVGALETWARLRRLERFLAWVVLPLTLLWTLAAWTLVVVFSIGTVVSADVCIANGTPDATVQYVLQGLQLDRSSTTFEVITAYTGVSSRKKVNVAVRTFSDN